MKFYIALSFENRKKVNSIIVAIEKLSIAKGRGTRALVYGGWGNTI